MKSNLNWVLVLTVITFLTLAFVLRAIALNWALENPYMYSVVDGFFGGIAIFLSLVLLLVRPYRMPRDYLPIAAFAFVSIGAAEIVGLLTMG
jgi:hypothetical protein